MSPLSFFLSVPTPEKARNTFFVILDQGAPDRMRQCRVVDLDAQLDTQVVSSVHRSGATDASAIV